MIKAVQRWARENRENIRDLVTMLLALALVIIIVTTVSLSVQVQRRNDAINRIDHASQEAQRASSLVAAYVRQLQSDAAARGDDGASNAAIAAGLQTIQEINTKLEAIKQQLEDNK